MSDYIRKTTRNDYGATQYVFVKPETVYEIERSTFTHDRFEWFEIDGKKKLKFVFRIRQHRDRHVYGVADFVDEEHDA